MGNCTGAEKGTSQGLVKEPAVLDTEQPAISHEGKHEGEMAVQESEEESSLASAHPKYTMALRVVLVLTSALFIAGQTLNTFAVKVHINLLGGLVKTHTTAEKYSIVHGIIKMFSKGYAFLGITILLWSGIWPHIKLVLLHHTWTASMTEKKRHMWLSVIGVVGKFSMLDVFVVTLIVSSIQFNNLGAPDSWVAAIAQEGIFVFFTAACISQGLSGLFAQLHNRKHAVVDDDDTKQSLASFSAYPWALALCAVVVIAGLVPGMFLSIYKLTHIIHSPPLKDTVTHEDYSMFSGVTACFSTKAYTSGHSFMAVMAIIVGVALPYLHMALCAMVVYWPLTRRQAQTVHSVVEILAEWAALDVFFLCLAPIAAELGPLTKELAQGHVEVSFSPKVGPLSIGVLSVVLELAVHYWFIGVMRARLAPTQQQEGTYLLQGKQQK